MKKCLKRIIACALAVLMLLTCAPLSSLADVEFDSIFATKAEAVSGYNAYAAVEWAKTHVKEETSVLFGTRYWYDGGDCANFVSECIYMGGLDPNSSWNHNGYLAHFSTSSNGSWIRAQQLHDYAISIGGQEINNPSVSQAEVGDLIFYKKTPSSRISHSAIVVEVGGGTLQIAYHSTDKRGEKTPNWHLEFANNCTYLIKMHGAKCTDRKIRDFDVYTAGSNSYGYSSTSTNSSRVFAFLSGEYAHVYETKVSGGITWGKTFRYGAWGWVNLATMNYKNHYSSGPVNHTMGAWTVKTVANCKTDGLSERVCTRCGYTEQKTTKGGHVTDPKATCTTQGICKICGVVTENALGHDWNDGTVTTAPNCTEAGIRTYVCKRNSSHTYTEEVAALGHNYEVTVDLPGCVTTGTTTYKCTRCGDSYVSDSEWSGYAAINPSDPKYAEFIGNPDLCKSRTEYRYKTKSTTTRENDTGVAPDVPGYILEKTEWRWNDYGAWNGWFEGTMSGSDSRQVETATVYGYYYFCCPTCGTHMHGWGTNACYTWAGGCGSSIPASSWVAIWSNYSWNDSRVNLKDWHGTGHYYTDFFGSRFFKWSDNGTPRAGYRYRDRTKHYTYTYYKWSDWSAWSTTARTANATTQVDTRTTYSFKQSALNHVFNGEFTKTAFRNVGKQLQESEINDVCYYIADTCARCGVLAPNPTPVYHDVPDFNTERDQYTIVEQNAAITVYKGVCRNGCECYYLKTVDNHNFVKLETIEPTCDDDGYTVYGCTIHPGEAEEYPDDFISALGDDYSHGKWERIVDPTCTKPGLEICKCKRFDACGHYITREVDPLGHTMNGKEAVGATCEKDGNSEYFYCSVCEKYFADEDGNTEIEVDSWVIPATGHKGTDENGEEIWITELGADCGVTGREYLYCINEWCDVSRDCDTHKKAHGYIIDEREIPEITPDYQEVEREESLCNKAGYVKYSCMICIGTDHEHGWTEWLPLAEHTWSDWETTKEPICINDGEKMRHCTVCGEKEFEVIPAEFENHDLITVTVDSTCTSGGYTYKKCTRCDYEEGKEEIDPTGHDIVIDENESYPATCEEPGLIVYVCTRGDYKDSEIIPAIGHAYEFAYHVPATCVEQGYNHYICQNDTSHTKDELIDSEPPLGHDYSAFVSNNDSTHTKECQRDICTPETEGHFATADCIYVDDTGYEANCTETGLTDGKHCIICDYKNPAQTEIAKLGHDFGEWYVETKATCTENGTLKRDCSRGDKSETNTIPARTHNMSEWSVVETPTCVNPGLEKRTCLNTEETEEYKACTHSETRVPGVNNDHDWDEWKQVTAPTCTEKGLEKRVCKRDSSHVETREVAINPNNHDWGNWEEVTAPTCTEKGLEKRVCKRDATHVETREVAINPNNHDWGNWEEVTAPTCTEKGLEKRICKRDSSHVETREVAIDPNNHDWSGEWKIETAPTIYTKGKEVLHCKNDASHIQTREIDKIESFTATFMVDDEVVEVVRIAKGTKYIKEPDLAPYDEDNSTIAWEEYQLDDKDIVIKAIRTSINPDDVSDIETDKEITQYDKGVATIKLSASAKSRTVEFLTSANAPVDVILVLDRSGSMEEPLGDKDDYSKLQALKDCANSFLNSLNDSAVKTGLNHRVALVGFGSGNGGWSSDTKWSSLNYEGTGIIVTNSGNAVGYKDIDDNKWNAWDDTMIDIGNIVGVNPLLTNSINGMVAEGATRTDLGLKMAKNILSAYKDENREQIVILLTDGDPTNYGTTEKAINAVVPDAITYAKQIKDSGAKLYTIGVKEGANSELEFDKTDDGINKTGSKITFDFNRFLNIVSSNYPTAQAMNNYGEKANSGYYLAVTNTDNLENRFSSILYSSITKPVVFKTATLVDTLTDDFTITLEQEYAMRENLKSEYNLSDEDISVQRNNDGTTTVRIENVPVKATEINGETKYIASVSFDCSLNKYEQGEYETNTDEAYVEVKGERIKDFKKPEPIKVKSDRNIVVFTINKEVYKISEEELNNKVVVPVTDLAKWTVDETVTGNYAVYEADEINTDEYTVTWIVDGEDITETYRVGQIISAPNVYDKGELEFKNWSPAVSKIMPARNLVYTAIYGEKHVCSFKQVRYYGSCKTGLIIVSECGCGAVKEDKLAEREHKFTAIINSYTTNTVNETIACSVCSHSENHVLTFKKSSSTSGSTTVIDINLMANGVSIQPNENGILIMIPTKSISGYSSKKKYSVRRLNENGVEKIYPCTVENGYLVFTADHFSIYVIGEENENNEPVEEFTYDQANCALNSHKYEAVTTKPTCTTEGFTTHTCSVCGDCYTDTVIAATGHKDENNDGICDTCKTDLGTHEPDPAANCSCNCHKKGIVKFFWKIINFFHKLFKMEKYRKCPCGTVEHW